MFIFKYYLRYIFKISFFLIQLLSKNILFQVIREFCKSETFLLIKKVKKYFLLKFYNNYKIYNIEPTCILMTIFRFKQI